MSRYTGPACRLCRAEGVKLMLKGERCMKEKCAISRQKPPPGMHTRKSKSSEYGQQLRSKQKIRRSYGLSERQFVKIFDQAARSKGITGENLLRLIELRLDNIVYHFGMAPSRSSARQAVTHGHVKVNGRRVSFPSFTCRKGDVIQLKDSDRTKALVDRNVKASAGSKFTPKWLSFDPEALKGQVVALPEREDIHLPENSSEQMVVELYSK